MQGRKPPGRRSRRQRAHKATSEPIVIAARRPPVRTAQALSWTSAPGLNSGEPRHPEKGPSLTTARSAIEPAESAPKVETRQATRAGPRQARIVSPSAPNLDPRETERQRLFDKLMQSEGRSAVSRAADEFQEAGFSFPEEQAVQLQLLEHFDERTAHRAIVALERIMLREHLEKRAVLEHRLRRLEELAEDPSTRQAAENLLRALR